MGPSMILCPVGASTAADTCVGEGNGDCNPGSNEGSDGVSKEESKLDGEENGDEDGEEDGKRMSMKRPFSKENACVGKVEALSEPSREKRDFPWLAQVVDKLM
ncbi:hypothetical protein PG994_002610 [Apiospora phragmitis]|uniref:Uncharacterized protein n=1 Tax=Apiospora phragmitis TaxID=2905665 RepID=A0ABR1W5R9_9PEZI